MSTLTSADMHQTRASTRVYAPPGGNTTISFGNYKEPAAEEKVEIIEEDDVQIIVEEIADFVDISTKVGIVAAEGEGIGDAIEQTKKALSDVGIDNVVVSLAPYVYNLAFLTQKLLKSCGAVVAVAFVSNDAAGSGSVSQVVTGSLLEVGIKAGAPVIPGILTPSSLLEGKAMVAVKSLDWASTTARLLGVSDDGAEVPPVPTKKSQLPPEETEDDVETLMEHFRNSLKSRGAVGIFGLQRKFRIMDDDNSNQISLAEFTKAVREHTFQWTPEQIQAVFSHLDADSSGEISFDEFLQAVRGTLNERRQQLVLQAFEILDADKSGVIEPNDIEAKYDASQHPDVIAGRRTNEEILREFLDTFDQGEKDGKVTPAEFCKYYANLSASIDNDDYFELMMRNAWHISGGEGWCANSSCRRVLVTHADGHQSVEEIKNDLGIGAEDKDAMMANLQEQGLDDIVGIDLFGSVDSAPSTPEVKDAPPASPQGRRAKGPATTIVLG